MYACNFDSEVQVFKKPKEFYKQADIPACSFHVRWSQTECDTRTYTYIWPVIFQGVLEVRTSWNKYNCLNSNNKRLRNGFQVM